jgi:carbon-monoxide dehydrogenase large subunit
MVSYLVPSAAEMVDAEIDRVSAPSPTNPMGVKGVGETGTIASPAAVMNAVVDALAPFGITDIAMPAKPDRVWAAIQEAQP